MDSATASIVKPARPWPMAAIVVVVFIAYTIFLGLRMGAYAGGADTSGYLNQARLLSAGQVHTPQRTLAGATGREFSDYLFVPLGFRPSPAGTMTPTYPIGLPLILVATAKLVGWQAAPPLVMAAWALLGLLLTALLAHEIGLSWSWSWFGALTLGVSPLYTIMSLELLSDVPATAAATAALICAWRSRRHPGWAVAAGAMCAAAVLIRPSNILLGLPVLICLGANWRCWVCCMLGGLPGAVAQFLYNAHAYGKGLESGYGDIFAIFSWQYVPGSLAGYVRWLWIMAAPVSLASLGLPWVARRAPALAWALGLWVVSLLGFYVGYKHTNDAWWALRFLLPVFPSTLVVGLYVVHRWWEGRQQIRPVSAFLGQRLAVGATLFILLHGVAWSSYYSAASAGRAEARYPAVSSWLQTHVPTNAVIVAMQGSGALHYYTDFTVVRYDMLAPGQFAQLTQLCLTAQRPIYAVLWPNDIRDFRAFSTSLPGHWSKIFQFETVSIWKPLPTPLSLINTTSQPPPTTAK